MLQFLGSQSNTTEQLDNNPLCVWEHLPVSCGAVG